MLTPIKRESIRRRVRHRIRRKLGQGTAARPRVAVFRTSKHIYVQAIDDAQGRTLAAVSTRSQALRDRVPRGGNIKAAEAVGEALAGQLKQAGIEQILFDRGGFLYHGRVKALAEAMRKGGLKF